MVNNNQVEQDEKNLTTVTFDAPGLIAAQSQTSSNRTKKIEKKVQSKDV